MTERPPDWLQVQRRRLFASLVGALLLLLSILLLCSYLMVRYTLDLQLEERLRWMGYAVAFSVEDEGGVPDFAESLYFGPGASELDPNTVAQWLDLQGQVLRSNGGLVLDPGLPLQTVSQSQTGPVEARVFTVLMRENGAPVGYARVGLGLEPMRRQLREILGGLVGAGLVVGLLLAWFGYWWTGRLLAPALEAYRELELFSAAVAHELRTPVAALRLNSESTWAHFESLTPEEIREALVEIRDAAVDAAGLVDGLLLLSNLRQTAPSAAQDCPQSLQLVESVVARYLDQAVEAGVALTLGSDGERALAVNPAHLEIILSNLLENALRYTPRGGTVAVRLGLDRLAVEDTGIGMSREETARAREPFWRSDAARQRCRGGTGLGLAIVAALARHNQAELILASEPGRGTRVEIRFRAPVATGH